MNRLWVRLSVALSGFVLIGVALLIGIGALVSQTGFSRWVLLEELRAPNGLVARLQTYYAERGTWDGVDTLLSENFGITEAIDGVFMALIAPDGTVIFPSFDGARFWRRPPEQPDPFPLAITVAGNTVGALYIAEPPPPRTLQLRALQRVSALLAVVGIAGGILGVVGGVVISRSLTAPLTQLAHAARALRPGIQQSPVSVQGTREILAVAQAFNEAAAALQAAETQRRNLLADVAHELRTPLSVIQGSVRAVLDDVYPLTKDELARVYEQTRLLSRLVNDLHELAQAEANQLHLNREPTRLDEIVGRTVSTFEPAAEDAGVALRFTADAVPPLSLDALRMAQVVGNLLGNAIRHTPTGGTVHVSIRQTAHDVHITIADSGEGIAPEHLPYIFDRFYRVDRSRSRESGGTGLGLAIARALVIAHGGSIRAASQGVQRGTTFTITLPQQRSVEL